MRISRRHFLSTASGATALAALSSPARAGEEEDPLGVRADFPAVREGIYLNSAYIAPPPIPVAAAGRAFLEAKSRRPISLDDMLAKTEEVRRQFARLIGASPEEVGFLSSTSEGENLVAGSLGLQPGDNVVLDELHFTTSYVLYKQLEDAAGIELRIARHRQGAVGREDFEPLVNEKTRLVSVAWVSHQNGFRHDLKPLADLAHAHGAWLYTDAIQAVGMFPIDVQASSVDFLTCGTYKWLLAGYGVAPFFARGELLDRIRPDRWGHLHLEKDLGHYRYQIYRTAKKLEYATLAFEAIYQLGASLAYLERVGVDRIEAHGVALARQLRQGLAERGFRLFTPPDNRSSIVSFFNKKDPEEARRSLSEERVQVSFREKGTQVRLSAALFNNASEIRRFLEIAGKLV